MVILRHLTIHNLFGIKHVERDLDNQGLVVVCGANGSGKSSFFMEGVMYTLYGQSFTWGKNPGNAVINRHGGKGGYGMMRLSVDDVPYVVVRARNHPPYRNGVSIYQGDRIEDGLDLTPVDTPQDLVTKLLGVPARTFSMSVMFPAEITRFPNMGDTERKAIFDDLVGTASLDDALKITKDKITLLREKLRDKVSEERTIVARLTTLGNELAENVEQGKTWAEDHQKRIGDNMLEIRCLKEDLVGCEDSVEGSRAAMEEDKEVYHEVNEGYLKEFSSLTEEKRKLNLDLGRAEERLTGIVKEVRRTADRVDKVRALVDAKRCPTCSADTSASVSLGKEISEEEDRLAEEKARLAEAQAEVSDLAAKLAALDPRLRLLAEDAKKVKRAQATWEESEATYRSITDNIRNIKARLSGRIEVVREMARAKNPHEGAVVRLTKVEGETRQLLEKTQAKREEAESALKDEEILQVVFGAKGARLSMIERVIPMLNAEAQRVAGIMGTSISVKFALRGDDESWSGQLQVDVTNTEGASEYKGQSRGEKRRADLIILLSLLKLAISRGLKSFSQVFFDEAFESIDPEGEEAVMEVMRDITKHCSSVFTINHTADRISSSADQVWTMADGELR